MPTLVSAFISKNLKKLLTPDPAYSIIHTSKRDTI
ncbi:Hypothetical protein TRBSAP_061 [Escherichia phage vB_Eco_SAP]